MVLHVNQVLVGFVNHPGDKTKPLSAEKGEALEFAVNTAKYKNQKQTNRKLPAVKPAFFPDTLLSEILFQHFAQFRVPG